MGEGFLDTLLGAPYVAMVRKNQALGRLGVDLSSVLSLINCVTFGKALASSKATSLQTCKIELVPT